MHPTSLWKNRDYILVWSAQVVSTFGSSVSGVIYPLLILKMSNSPAAAGIASALTSVPYIVFSLPVGALIDRLDRKRVMIICDFGRFLVLGSIALLLWSDQIQIWHIYVASLLEGSFYVFFNIAEVAALPRIVPKHLLPAAAAQNDAANSTAVILGPSFGTYLFQSFGRVMPFAFDALSFALSSISLLFIKSKFQSERKQAKRHLIEEIKEGVAWLWHQPLIRYMALLTGATNLVNAAMPLIVIVIAKEMGALDTQIGLIFSLSGIGGVVGSLIGGQIQKRFTFGQVITAAMWVQALLFPLILVMPQHWLLGVVLGGMFLVGPIYNVVQFSYRISIIPDALQGRVNSVFRLVAFGFNPLGAAIAGILLEKYGASVAVWFLGVLLFIFSVVTMRNSHVKNASPVANDVSI